MATVWTKAKNKMKGLFSRTGKTRTRLKARFRSLKAPIMKVLKKRTTKTWMQKTCSQLIQMLSGISTFTTLPMRSEFQSAARMLRIWSQKANRVSCSLDLPAN